MAQNIDTMLIDDKKTRVSGTSFAVAEAASDVTGTFNDRSITYNGSLINYDFDRILRDKQGNINNLYMLADYFVDSEELIGSAIHQILVPFSLIDGWQLTGGSDQVREKYYNWFEQIHFNEKLESWFYQYYLFANVYFSIMDDSDVVSLPPHLCRISNVLVNGNPIIEFNARSVKQDLKKQGQKALKKFIEDENLDIRVAGYPKEVMEALKRNVDYVQLDPKRNFVLQASKPEWQRYAVPMITRCLLALGKKALIDEYVKAILNLAAASFVHGAVGSPNGSEIIVDRPILESILQVTKSAMQAGNGVCITNDGVTYHVIQPDMDKIFEQNPYSNVNETILGALGINNSVTSGTDASISFGSASISTRVVSMRITAARQAMSKVVNRLMRAVNGSPYGLPRSNDSKLPTFVIPDSDLTQVAAFQKECMKLWESGVLSTKTLLDSYHVDIKTEFERKQEEKANGIADLFVKPGTLSNDNNREEKSPGRPTMDDDERQSDPANSITGRQEKPSRPQGSEEQEK